MLLEQHCSCITLVKCTNNWSCLTVKKTALVILEKEKKLRMLILPTFFNRWTYRSSSRATLSLKTKSFMSSPQRTQKKKWCRLMIQKSSWAKTWLVCIFWSWKNICTCHEVKCKYSVVQCLVHLSITKSPNNQIFTSIFFSFGSKW